MEHLNKVQRYFEAHGTAYLVLECVEGGETLSAFPVTMPGANGYGAYRRLCHPCS